MTCDRKDHERFLGVFFAQGGCIACQCEHEVTQKREAIELLIKCYKAGHRQGWEDSQSNDEVFDEVNDFLSMEIGPDWERITND